MIVSLMAAMSENHVIGHNNKLPWNIPEDLARLRKLTTGHVVVMGRKTFDSIGRPLPNRTNIVITRNTSLQIPDVRVVGSVEAALEPYRDLDEEVFILGGAEIYKQTLSLADRIYLTVIHKDFQGDAFFPAVPQKQFQKVLDERHEGPLAFTFFEYHRV